MADNPGAAAEAVARQHLTRIGRANRAFFEAAADAVPLACRDMARRFRRGGRLLVAGTAASASDAWHVSVEFLHPVLIGKRALPAIVLDGDPAGLLGVLGRADDIVICLDAGRDSGMAPLLQRARASGILTLALTGGGTGDVAADYVFRVPDDDPLIVQEVHETCYHVLYELVHVFLEHQETQG